VSEMAASPNFVAATYPVMLNTSLPPSSNRFWAIPLVGILGKAIILIPHLIILYVLGLAVGVCQLVIWAGVLFGGRYPDWAYALVAGYLRWSMRLSLYFYGIRDDYPAFSMELDGDPVIERPTESSRFWAIPIVGFLVKYIILIPHGIVLYALGIAVGVCQLVIWVWVLFGGRYPGWAYSLNTGTLQWFLRVYSYFFGLTDRYPPFSFT